MPPKPVEIRIPARTLLSVVAVAGLIALALVSLGTLISILLAAVLAFGLDPVVAALVRRGWNRGRASLFTFAALFLSVFLLILLTAGPVWEQITEFVQSLPAMWAELTSKPGFQDILSTFGADDHVASVLKELAAGLPDAASALLGLAGNVFGSVLELVTLTFLALFLLMERPMITDWLFGYTPPEADDALASRRRGLDPGDLHLADRQRRDLVHRRHGRRSLGVGCSTCRSRSCWPSSPACST